jgi:hypothetical protein
MGRFLPADHTQGDANTLGGYAAVHARPPAFEGSDGTSYSVEIITDANAGKGGTYASYILFVRWREGDPVASGHLETAYLSSGKTEAEARLPVEHMLLSEVREKLEELIAGGEHA